MTWMRNVARLGALASVGFVLVFLFGGKEALPVGSEWLKLTFFPIGVCIGLLLAFWRERLGGTLALACLAAFYAQSLIASGSLPRGPWFALVAAPALLFLIAGSRRPAVQPA